jgi:hypothetical protein
MPQPSSETSIRSMPPPEREIAIRPFDHFAGRDPVNKMFGETAY